MFWLLREEEEEGVMEVVEEAQASSFLLNRKTLNHPMKTIFLSEEVHFQIRMVALLNMTVLIAKLLDSRH